MEVQANKSFFDSLKRIGSFGEKLRELRGWIRYHVFNKNFKKLHKTVMKSYPWDYSFLYELERAKIEEMCKYHEKHQRFTNWEYVVRDMKLCMKLIDIFTNKVNLFHYDGNIVFNPIEGSEDYEVSHTPDFKYVCDVKVNTRNIDRFIPRGKDCPCREYWKEHAHEVYILKAKALYHKIRLEKDFEWWD
jgi:hypothetical protein